MEPDLDNTGEGKRQIHIPGVPFYPPCLPPHPLWIWRFSFLPLPLLLYPGETIHIQINGKAKESVAATTAGLIFERELATKSLGVEHHRAIAKQARWADGADYIGVGPLFATATKANVCAPVGLSCLDHVVQNIKLPFVTIGGIKEHNLAEVVRHGATSVCLVTEIVGADNITGAVKLLQNNILRGI